MNKNELIDKVSAKTGLSVKDSKNAVNAVFESVIESLDRDEKVSIVGFGTFEVKTRAPHKGRNPRTGEEVLVPEYRAVVFKSGNKLKGRSVE